MKLNKEILIHAAQVTHNDYSDAYEFVINDSLQIIDCVKIDALDLNAIIPILLPNKDLEDMLFELNHVRVNPKADNSYIIDCLTNALRDIGVNVNNRPEETSMAMCFKPMGEISSNVRFYIGHQQQLVFLSPATKPKLVSVNGKEYF